MTTWREIIDEAKNAGYFHVAAKNKAGNWGSCALAEKLGLNDAEAVLSATRGNKKLRDLGSQFSGDVDHDRIPAAEATYEEIMATPL